MAEGRGKLAWAQTASLMAHITNLWRNFKKPLVQAELFNPYAEHKPKRRVRLPKKEVFALLKMVFVDNANK